MSSERRHNRVYSMSLLIVAFSVCIVVALFTLDSSVSAGVTPVTQAIGGGNTPSVVGGITSEFSNARASLGAVQMSGSSRNAWDQGNRAAESILKGMGNMIPDQLAIDVRRGVSNTGVRASRGWDKLKYWMFH